MKSNLFGKITSKLSLDLQKVRQRSLSHRGEGQDPQTIGDTWEQVAQAALLAVIRVLLLPAANWSSRIGAIEDSVSLDLTVGLFRRFPLDQHGVGIQHVSLDVERRRRRCLLAGPGIHNATGRTAADVIDSQDSELVPRERAETSDAVARGCYAIHFLETILRQFGTVLDDVVGHRLGVARVPGQGDAGCCGFCNSGGGGLFGQGC